MKATFALLLAVFAAAFACLGDVEGSDKVSHVHVPRRKSGDEPRPSANGGAAAVAENKRPANSGRDPHLWDESGLAGLIIN